MSQENKTKEIIILSDCEDQPYKVGLEIYKKYTKDEHFNSKDLDENDPRTIHPTTEKQIINTNCKIHFFDIQDRYWPAISNICRHCDGAIFAMDLDNDKKDQDNEQKEQNENELKEVSSENKKEEEEDCRVEFINEWLVNLDDLDKEDMSKIIVGVTKSPNDSNVNNKSKILSDLADEKKIGYQLIHINGQSADKEIGDAFVTLVKKITGDTGSNSQRGKVDEDLEEILDKYKNF